MTRPGERIEELAKQGAIERRELASALRASAEAARSVARRVAPVAKTAGAGLAVAGFGLTVAAVIRRIRGRRRPKFAWERMRRSLQPFINARIGKKKPRALPATLLLALARSKTVRRAIASAVQKAAQNRREADPVETDSAPSSSPVPATRQPGSLTSSRVDSPSPSPSPESGPDSDSTTAPAPLPRDDAKAAPLPKKFGIGVDLLKASYQGFSEDEGFARAASLAYYTLFSLAPLLLVAVGVAGLLFGQRAAEGRLLAQIQDMVGPDAARILQTMMAKAQKPSANIIATVFGIVTLLLGAAGVFGNLQQSLNRIWGVREGPHGGFWKTVQQRFLSFAMVLGTGFLLLVSLIVSAALSAFADLVRRTFPGAVGIVLNSAHAIFSWAIVGVIFALIFKYLPDTRVAWPDVWIGAAMTALLFVTGQWAIGLYIGKTFVSSVYAGAAALAIILIWTYYSAAIFFFGAEITQIFANWYGSKIEQERTVTGSSPWQGLRRSA